MTNVRPANRARFRRQHSRRCRRSQKYFLERKIMVKSLFCISVSLGLIGMGLGIFMGMRQDFTLMAAHAHLNLLGFVVMFLSALYYRAFPEAAVSRLAPYQAVVSVVGAIAFPIGIACVILGGHERFASVVAGGALTVLLGLVLFAVIVFRTAGSGRAAAGSRPS
jgi:cation transport ATPase